MREGGREMDPDGAGLGSGGQSDGRHVREPSRVPRLRRPPTVGVTRGFMNGNSACVPRWRTEKQK